MTNLKSCVLDGMADYIVKQQQYRAILLLCNVAIEVMKPFTKDVFRHQCLLIVVIHDVNAGIEILETPRVSIFANDQWLVTCCSSLLLFCTALGSTKEWPIGNAMP